MQQTQPLKTWMNILTHPGIETFSVELENTQAKSSKSTGKWLFISIVLFALLRGLSVFIAQLLGNYFNGPSQSLILLIMQQLGLDSSSTAEIVAITTSPFFGLTLVFVSLLLVTPIIILAGYGTGFATAKFFGGTGNFSNHAYSLTTFVAPLLILAGLFGLLGFLGDLLFFLAWVYAFVLTFYAIITVHNISNVRAFVSTLIPFLLMIITSIMVSLII